MLLSLLPACSMAPMAQPVIWYISDSTAKQPIHLLIIKHQTTVLVATRLLCRA
jgi:hypothetical protein